MGGHVIKIVTPTNSALFELERQNFCFLLLVSNDFSVTSLPRIVVYSQVLWRYIAGATPRTRILRATANKLGKNFILTCRKAVISTKDHESKAISAPNHEQLIQDRELYISLGNDKVHLFV